MVSIPSWSFILKFAVGDQEYVV